MELSRLGRSSSLRKPSPTTPCKTAQALRLEEGTKFFGRWQGLGKSNIASTSKELVRRDIIIVDGPVTCWPDESLHNAARATKDPPVIIFSSAPDCSNIKGQKVINFHYTRLLPICMKGISQCGPTTNPGGNVSARLKETPIVDLVVKLYVDLVGKREKAERD